jgi:hypothetical protein
VFNFNYAVTSTVPGGQTLLNGPEGWWRLVRGKKIDRVAVLRNLQTIEDNDYDAFVILVQAARNRHLVFDPDLPVWQVAQRMGIIVDCNRGGVPEFEEEMRDFVRDRNNVDGSDKQPFVKGRY